MLPIKPLPSWPQLLLMPSSCRRLTSSSFLLSQSRVPKPSNGTQKHQTAAAGQTVKKTNMVLDNPYMFISQIQPPPKESTDSAHNSAGGEGAKAGGDGAPPERKIPEKSPFQLQSEARQRGLAKQIQVVENAQIQASRFKVVNEREVLRRQELSENRAKSLGVNVTQPKDASPIFQLLSSQVEKAAAAAVAQSGPKEAAEGATAAPDLPGSLKYSAEVGDLEPPTGVLEVPAAEVLREANPSSVRKPGTARVTGANARKILQQYQRFRNQQRLLDGRDIVRHSPFILQTIKDLSFASRDCYVHPSEDLTDLLSDLTKAFKHFPPAYLSGSAWALGVMAEHTEINLNNVYDELLRCCTPEMLQKFAHRDLSKLVWMLSTAGISDPALFERIEKEVIDKIDTFTLQNISLVAWGFSKAKVQSDRLFQVTKSHIKLDNYDESGREHACLAAAYENRPQDRDFLEQLASFMETRLSTYNEKSMANILGSYTIAGLFPQKLFEQGFQAIERKHRNFGARELVKLAIAFAASEIPCQEATARLTTLCTNGLKKFTPADLSLLLWALASNPYYKESGFFTIILHQRVFRSPENFSKAGLMTILYALVRQKYDPLPEQILAQVLDPTFLPSASHKQQLMTAWVLNVMRSDLRGALSTSGRRKATPEDKANSMVGPMGDMASEEKGRVLIIRLGTVLKDFSEMLSHPDFLRRFSARELACVASSFALGSQNRDAFLNLWVPMILDSLVFSEPLFKESLLLLLSSYHFHGIKSGPYLSRIVDKISYVHEGYTGRDLAHLAGLVNIFGLNLPSITERAKTMQSSIDPAFHRFLVLTPRNFSLIPSKEFATAHKQLLSECVGKLLQPAIQDMFDEAKSTLGH